jgi:hypothetical protein
MEQKDLLAQECRRLARNTCLYTSTSLFLWLRFLRLTHVVCLVMPVVFGSLASLEILTSSSTEGAEVWVAILAFLAGLIPAMAHVLKLDEHILETAKLAGEFKNLQDRFEIAAVVSSKKSFPEFEQEFQTLMERLEIARSESYTAPQIFFLLARRQIKRGHYDPD